MKEFITGDGYAREVADYHKWSERRFEMKATPVPIINPETKIVAIGSCFASEVVKYLSEKKFNITAHPNGLLYNTFTIRDHLNHLFNEETPYHNVLPVERGRGEWRHPYKKISVSASRTDAETLSKKLDEEARTAWREADVVILTLGLTEVWENQEGLTQIEIPHPNIFNKEDFSFRKTYYSENLANLENIYKTIHSISKAKMIVTVSPVPLYMTFSNQDVTVANSESKSILRAAAGEFVSRHDDVFYFPSFEIVMYSMDPSVYLKEDGRHVRKEGVNKIMSQFIKIFGSNLVDNPEIDADEKIRLSGVDSSTLKRKKKSTNLMRRLIRKIFKVFS